MAITGFETVLVGLIGGGINVPCVMVDGIENDSFGEYTLVTEVDNMFLLIIYFYLVSIVWHFWLRRKHPRDVLRFRRFCEEQCYQELGYYNTRVILEIFCLTVLGSPFFYGIIM